MMFAQANSEHCRHKIFNAEFVIDGVRAARSSLFAMIRNTYARAPGRRAVGLSRQCRGDRRQRGDALVAGSGQRHLSRQRRADRHPHEGRDAQSSDRDLAVSRRGHRRGRRDPRRGRDRPRRQAQGGPGGLLGLASAHSRVRCSRGSSSIGKPARIASALEIMLEGPIGAAAFNNEFGRPNICGYFRTLETALPGDRARARARLSQADHAGRRPRQRAPRPGRQERGLGRRGAGGARRPGDADRAWAAARRPRSAAAARTRSSISPRCSAATPRCSGARRKSSIAAGRWAPTIRSSSSTMSAPAACPMRCPKRSRTATAARASSCARFPTPSPACRRSRSGATRRRSATCWLLRPGALARFAALARARALSVRRDRQITDDGRAGRARSAVSATMPVHMPIDALLGNPPRMRRDGRAVASARCRPRDCDAARAARGGLSRAALAGGRRQDLSDHDRRSHGRRPDQPRSAGRSVAGAGQRCGGDAGRLSRHHAGEAMAIGERTPAALLDARRLGAAGGQPRRSPISWRPISRACSEVRLSANWMAACGERGRGCRAVRGGARRRRGALSGARHRHPGRQGLAVDEDRLASRRGAERRCSRRCR